MLKLGHRALGAAVLFMIAFAFVGGFVAGRYVYPAYPVDQTFAGHIIKYCYHVSPAAIPPPYSNYLNASGYDIYVCRAGTT
jgi:hypothetical protein